MKKPFTRKDLTGDQFEVMYRGRWANADLYLYRKNGQVWVLKDFQPCTPFVRKTWGRFLIRREYQALSRLRGIKGIPGEPFVMDAYAIGYQYIPGRTLRETPPNQINDRFFYHLEDLVKQMHERNMVHLDIRNRRNVLITDNGLPALLDFQSSFNLDRVPRMLHSLMKDIDISGVYKIWQLKQPETLDQDRKARLTALNKKRFLWFLRGYPLGTRKAPRE